MSIHMRSLSPDTFAAIEKLSSERQWPELMAWMEPELIAWLAIRLEFVQDCETYFPRGKWATIQRLQDMLRAFAARDEKPSDAER